MHLSCDGLTFASVAALKTHVDTVVKTRDPKCLFTAVLFDGAGLARLGLERAGHICVGVELSPIVHALGSHVGSGNCILGDARTTLDLSLFDCIWASPPCQSRSQALSPDGTVHGSFSHDLLQWSLDLVHTYPTTLVIVENVLSWNTKDNAWCMKMNSAQVLHMPLQARNRGFGGRFHQLLPADKATGPTFTLHDYDFGVPALYRPYKRFYKNIHGCYLLKGRVVQTPTRASLGGRLQYGARPDGMTLRRWQRTKLRRRLARNARTGVCPACTATEQCGSATDTRRAGKFYGRKLSLEECAFHMGFAIPAAWWTFDYAAHGETKQRYLNKVLYRALGNGVPTFLACALGTAQREQITDLYVTRQKASTLS